MNTPDASIRLRAKIRAALADARRDLVDLSRRNRLLHSPRAGKRPHCLEVVGAEVDALFSALARAGKSVGFLSEDNILTDISGDSVAPSRMQLRTHLQRETLDRRLLKLFREARTHEEEQGVNILFLAMGFLKWFEDSRSEEPNWAPLLLVPAALDRRQGRDNFLLKARDEELVVNISLREKLRAHSIDLPDVPEGDEWVPSQYFDAVSSAVASENRWEIDRGAVGLGFFTFSKFLMWRDLDASSWPSEETLLDHELISVLLEEGAKLDPPPLLAADDESIDRVVDLASAVHLLDADSSQALAVEEARLGRNLVVQGPPGTGKSQTIANIIAGAAHAGKSVLFVAEKAAALDVVHSRLKGAGLEPLCLELHSRKATKLNVVASLKRALGAAGAIQLDSGNSEALRVTRDHLNEWSTALHKRIGNSGRTPYQVMGTVLKLRAIGAKVLSERFEAAAKLDEKELRIVEDTVERAATAVARLGIAPIHHRWRGCRGGRLAPFDVDRLRHSIRVCLENLQVLQARISDLQGELGNLGIDRFDDLPSLASFLRHLASVPPRAREAFASVAWHSERTRIAAMLSRGHAWAENGPSVRAQFMEVAWSTDLAPLRLVLDSYGSSPFRILSSRYRMAIGNLRKLARNKLPRQWTRRIAMIDDLISMQTVRKSLAADGQFAKEAFGAAWAGEDSDWVELTEMLTWAEGVGRECSRREIFADIAHGSPEKWVKATVQIEAAADTLRREFENIQSVVKIVATEILGVTTWGEATPDILSGALLNWFSDVESFNDWVAVREALDILESVGLGPVARGLINGTFTAAEARPIVDLLIAEALWRRACSENPIVNDMDGSRRTTYVEEFRARDRKRIEHSRAEVLAKYLQTRPTGVAGEMGVIRAEIGKKRRHLPIRKLMERAGLAMQRLKPVFLMSPLSVAQFLPSGHVQFDLVVIDEASQVTPEGALGAIARSRQMIVVGDDKQLPPTNFFRLVAGDDDEDVADEMQPARTRDFESILTLARARGVPERMLRWHYRSRHPSLIALSNSTCYGGSLLLPPSPKSLDDGLGLSLIATPPGNYDRGGSGSNLVEADIVVGAIEKHLQEQPELSLGVACFSVSQRDAIEDALQRRGLLNAAENFAPNGERLFVKNLEAVQGDERDVIFISIGYGRDAQGRTYVSFGPVSADGGERRLNVLISRARFRCVVFSSMTAGDIPADAKSRGARMLRDFLHYAETGKIAAGQVTGADYDSAFEESVALAIRREGYEVAPQVGVSAFRIDLGVVDPESPGRFVLGVECDGAGYHSARSARDRDRLRQEVLEGLGWRLYRIWSTDWFRNPARETKKLLESIAAALADRADTRTPAPADMPSGKAASSADTQSLGHGSTKIIERSSGPVPVERRSIAYRECRLSVPQNVGPLDLGQSRLAELAVIVVQSEGPIHVEEVARRIREGFGLDRTGHRILAVIEGALQFAERRGMLKSTNAFWSAPGISLSVPRDRRKASPAIRRADRVAPEEYQVAIRAVLDGSVALNRDELIVEAARLLGFDRTGADLQAAIGAQIIYLTDQVKLVADGERIRLP